MKSIRFLTFVLCGLCSINLFVCIMVAEKSKIKVLADSASGDNSLPSLHMTTTLLCLQVAKRKRALVSLLVFIGIPSP